MSKVKKSKMQTAKITSSVDRPLRYRASADERVKIDMDPEEALRTLLRPTKPKKK